MKKIKAFYEKHKAVVIGGLSLLILAIFYLFMKGRSSTPAVSNSPSYGIVPPPASSGGQAVDTGASSTPQDNGSILNAISNSLQSLFNNQSTLSDKIANVNQQIAQVKDNVSTQLQTTNAQTSAVGQAVTGLTKKINDVVTMNQPGTPAPNPVNSIEAVLQSATQALTNAHNGYYTAKDTASQDYYHQAATVARANVLKSIEAAGAASGYKTQLVDSGAGYSNVVVTDPNGKQTKF